MAKNVLKILLILLSVLLVGELIFLGVMALGKPGGEPETEPTVTEAFASVPETTEIPTTAAPTEAPTTAPAETEPTVTESGEIRYTLTFVGDCTLGSEPDRFSNPHSFVGKVGQDYDYPFQHVRDIFESDDFTIINLESVLADKGSAAGKLFTFRGPVAYTQILTGSSVEGVTLANNHTGDFGKEGYASTVEALENAGLAFVEENKTQLVTTESGLVIGLYADCFQFSKSEIQKNVQSLRSAGAEIIVCAFHWGTEGSYRPTAQQKEMAHAAIDAGADIVYGHHPHVLQPIESYNDGIIFYSLGNFSFGGNNFPRDKDSAIVQQEIIRDEEGNVRLGQLVIIPVAISSDYKTSSQNNYQPIPYEEGSPEYDRTMSKLDGTFTGPDLNVNYDHLKPTEGPSEGTVPPEQGGEEVTEPAESGGEVTPPPTQGGQTPPEEGGGETPPPAEGGGENPPPAEGGGETPPPAEGGDSGAEG